MLAKLAASFFGLMMTGLKSDLSVYLQAFLIGILPIWSEVLASRITRVEPSLEKSKKWLIADAVVDALVFLIVPGGWFLWMTHEARFVEGAAVLIFVLGGVWRLINFTRTGLNTDGYFRGLPVTYTGYLWILLILCRSVNGEWLVAPLLLLVTWAMITRRIKIKVSSVS